MLVAIRIQLIFISFFVLFCILQMYYVYIYIFQYRWIKTVKYKKNDRILTDNFFVQDKDLEWNIF